MMRIISSTSLVAFVATVFQAVAQTRMSAPVTGYVFDSSARSLRAVVGVPGAAGAGDRLALTDSLSAAFPHPSLPVAVVVTKDGSVMAASWKDAAHPQQAAIASRFGTPDRIAFAVGTDRALLISAAGIELWSGLAGGSAAAVYAYDNGMLGGTPRNGALSSDGALAAVVLDSGRIVEASENGLADVGEGRSAAYGPQSSDVFVIGADGTLLRAGNMLASGLAGDSELTGMGGFDGVVALSVEKNSLSLIDSIGGQVTRVPCGGCKPVRAQSLATPGILYFEDDERGGLLLDTSTGGPPRIVPVAGIDGRRNQ